MKRYLIPLMIILISLLFAACTPQQNFTSTPTETFTPSATITISIEQITAAATYRRTLPPSFTPTHTPTATYTPSMTPTRTITPTPTTVPESVLCDNFVVGIVPPVTTQGIAMLVGSKYAVVAIHLRLSYVETGEILLEGDLPGGNTLQLQFIAKNLPYSGDYHWEMFLADKERINMCPHEGTFTIEKPEATAEATAELTLEALEVAPEMTEELTPELTVEATAEATEAG